MHDHRMAMVAAGIATLLLSIMLFGTLVDVLLPAAEQRLFARQHHHAAGQHAEADRGGGRPCRGDHRKDQSVDRVFERVNVGEGHVNIVLKKHRDGEQQRVRAQPVARRSRHCPTRA